MSEVAREAAGLYLWNRPDTAIGRFATDPIRRLISAQIEYAGSKLRSEPHGGLDEPNGLTRTQLMDAWLEIAELCAAFPPISTDSR